jgi:hypothetical protein
MTLHSAPCLSAARYIQVTVPSTPCFWELLYVLHCFQKKTEKTGKMDIDLARKRYAELVKEAGA